MTGDYSERGLSDLVARDFAGAKWAQAEIVKLRNSLIGVDSAVSQGFLRSKPIEPPQKAAPKQFE